MEKKAYFCFSQNEKEEVNYPAPESLRSMGGISLPAFSFEFLVEQASNRMIDKRSNKGFKVNSTFIYCLISSAKL